MWTDDNNIFAQMEVLPEYGYISRMAGGETSDETEEKATETTEEDPFATSVLAAAESNVV